MALFGMTAKNGAIEIPAKKAISGTMPTMSQLVCLSNLENLNALFINEGLPQGERLS